MSCPCPAPKGPVSPRVCPAWGDILNMGPRGCPVPMRMVGSVTNGRARGGLVLPALVLQGMWNKAGR